MKKNLSLYISALILYLIILLGMWSSCSGARDNGDETAAKDTTGQVAGEVVSTTTCINPVNEDKILLSLYPLEQNTGIMEIDSCMTNIRVLNKDSLVPQIDSIPADKFCQLKDSAYKLIGSYTNYISALKITFGLANDDKHLVPLYQPILCNRTAVVAGTGTYNINYHNPNQYYKYDAANARFVVVPGLQVNTLKQNYINKIRIKHQRGGPLAPHKSNSTNDTLNDVVSLIFNFQEIDSLILDNNNTPKVRIWNALTTVTVSGASYQKHTLLLSPAGINIYPFLTTAKVKLVVFNNRFANLAHLCPPSCGPAIVFRLR